MAPEVFHGPWQVEVVGRDAWFDQQFVIAGSSNADGSYPGVVGQAVSVDGADWSLSLEWRDQGPWEPSRVQRSADYDVMLGLSVTLGADDGPVATADFDYNDVVILCRSLDPAHDPNRPTRNPYDFSIPEKVLVPSEQPKHDKKPS